MDQIKNASLSLLQQQRQVSQVTSSTDWRDDGRAGRRIRTEQQNRYLGNQDNNHQRGPFASIGGTNYQLPTIFEYQNSFSHTKGILDLSDFADQNY